jgi:uncharacterized membrane protein YGL010W
MGIVKPTFAMSNMHILSCLFMLSRGNLLPMKNVRENVAIALLIAVLIIVAFWSVEIRLGLLTAIIAVIAYLAFVPALWEKRRKP